MKQSALVLGLLLGAITVTGCGKEEPKKVELAKVEQPAKKQPKAAQEKTQGETTQESVPQAPAKFKMVVTDNSKGGYDVTNENGDASVIEAMKKDIDFNKGTESNKFEIGELGVYSTAPDTLLIAPKYPNLVDWDTFLDSDYVLNTIEADNNIQFIQVVDHTGKAIATKAVQE